MFSWRNKENINTFGLKKASYQELCLWCTPWEKGSYAICEQLSSRCLFASIQSDLDILCSSTYSTIAIDSVSRHWSPWSACLSAQLIRAYFVGKAHKGPFSVLPIINILHVFTFFINNSIVSLREQAYSNILKILPPKNESFQMKNSKNFHISARWGGSNKYPQSMFLSRNKKNNVYPCKPQFYYIKVGSKGVFLWCKDIYPWTNAISERTKQKKKASRIKLPQTNVVLSITILLAHSSKQRNKEPLYLNKY